MHVSRLGEYVLWTMPQTEEADHLPEAPLYAFQALGAIAFPVVRWNALPSVRRADRFPPANHAAIADAWILGPARSTSTIVNYLREQLVGGDTLEKSAAIALVDHHLRGLLANGDKPFEGDVLKRSSEQLETLYFDGPAENDWPPFAFRGDEVFLALDREHLIKTL